MVTSTASTPAPPASANAAIGPAPAMSVPDEAAPIAPPIAIALANQAKASVVVPGGAASSTMAFTLASAGAIAPPASSSTAPSDRMPPDAGIRAR
jgi:hypothetical protein